MIAVFVCVAALAILDRLDIVDVDTLAWWLAERQLPNGGLNGRPEKLEDVSCVFSYLSPDLVRSPLPFDWWGRLRVIICASTSHFQPGVSWVCAKFIRQTHPFLPCDLCVGPLNGCVSCIVRDVGRVCAAKKFNFASKSLFALRNVPQREITSVVDPFFYLFIYLY